LCRKWEKNFRNKHQRQQTKTPKTNLLGTLSGEGGGKIEIHTGFKESARMKGAEQEAKLKLTKKTYLLNGAT